MTAITATFLLLALIGNFLATPVSANNGSFAGFQNLSKAFFFGDSWSRINFDPEGPQPSPSNPFGNHGQTSSDGKNWVDFLVTNYNESLFLAYDLAQSGAVVDKSVVQSTTGADVVHQIGDVFVPKYAHGFFNPSSTLALIWIGINDLVGSYLAGDTSTNTAIINRLYTLVQELHEAGLRNFLFLNAPPLERCPRVALSAENATRVPLMRTTVMDYNAKLYRLAEKVKSDLGQANVFFYDAYTLFNDVIDGSDRFNETSFYRDTHRTCGAYTGGTPNWDDKYAQCLYAANEYLWINDLHPTQPVHQLLAREVWATLSIGEPLKVHS